MPSGYVDLAGTLRLLAQVASGGAITISFSRNHGVDWTPISTITTSGAAVVDLSAWVRRQYDYRLRIELAGFGTGFDQLAIEDVVQHSQRALPALGVGDNQIHVSAGADEGTVTLEANSDASQNVNRTYLEYHPTLDNLIDGILQPKGGKGAVTFPVETPGDLKRLRFGTFYRARGAGDRWDYQVSFDRGASWIAVDAAVGPTPGAERFVTFDRIPAGTRQALVRFSGTQVNTLRIFDFRIDADYAEPNGTFTPLEIRYDWSEGGQARSDVHVAASADERYVIHCNATPVMRSLTVSRASGR
jgi:hypothetical protein